MFFFFKQKTAYEMRISDWSSDVCSSDLALVHFLTALGALGHHRVQRLARRTLANDHVQPLTAQPCDGSVLVLPDDIRHADLLRTGAHEKGHKNGRASCRERVCQYV